MARPKNSNAADTRRRVLTAAAEEFGSRGFDAARLEDIAVAAGIRRSSLLYHFESKEGLYRETIDFAAADVLAAMASALGPGQEDGGPLERFDTLFDAFEGFVQTRPGSVAMFARELLAPTGAAEQHLVNFGRVLSGVEAWVRAQAGPLLPASLPVRALVAHVFAGYAVRVASRQDDAAIWGAPDELRRALRGLLAATFGPVEGGGRS